MKFRTEINCPAVSNQLDHHSSLVLLGSCFSEHMEGKFQYFKFDTFANPFGILFNPKAIETAVRSCVENGCYSKENLLKHGELWLSLNHHSKFDNRDPKQVLDNINKNIAVGHRALREATHVIITLGTSWVYKWKENNSIVGNCHKIPQKSFNKELLSSEEIVGSLRQIAHLIRSINKNASFIFTVSPVRHLKDGFIENTLSKSLLHKAIHEVKKEIDADYFPAYEIMMDDLRDYRFYKKDLVHPNEMAIDYIWELFKESWISESSRQIMIEIDDIQKSLAHRAFDASSEAHIKFLKKTEQKIELLKKKLPEIEFNKKRK
jgi:hypothetical protein